MEAICLSRLSPHKSAYTTSSQTCNAWASGEIGAIDSPGFDGTEYEQEGRVKVDATTPAGTEVWVRARVKFHPFPDTTVVVVEAVTGEFLRVSLTDVRKIGEQK